MSLRHAHVPTERLAVLALAGTDDEQGADAEALKHVSTCHACATALSRLTTDLEALRHEAVHEADEHFPDAMLDAQRTRVLERLEHIGQVARVLRFPVRAAKTNVSRPAVNRRLISVAAAAGLLVGLATGQVMHLAPWQHGRAVETRAVAAQAPPASTTAGGVVPVAATASLTDYVRLTEVDAAVQLRRAADIMAFDVLTPSADIP